MKSIQEKYPLTKPDDFFQKYGNGMADIALTENDGNSTFKVYHGGKRWSRIPEQLIAAKKNRYEANVGIYFTNFYNRARQYAKGSNVVQLVEINKNFRNIKDVKLNLTSTIKFLNNLSGLRRRSELIEILKDNAARRNVDYIDAYVLNNLIINLEIGAGKIGLELSKYLVDNGVDANVENKSNGEFWLIVFNPSIIKKISVVNPAKIDKNFEFELPNPFVS
jgi:hypothetical protein